MTDSLHSKMHSPTYFIVRATLEILFFVLVFIVPWWFTTLFGIFLLVRFRAYEVILAGILLDTIYTGTGSFLGGTDFVFTSMFLCVATITFFLCQFATKYLRV